VALINRSCGELDSSARGPPGEMHRMRLPVKNINGRFTPPDLS